MKRNHWFRLELFWDLFMCNLWAGYRAFCINEVEHLSPLCYSPLTTRTCQPTDFPTSNCPLT